MTTIDTVDDPLPIWEPSRLLNRVFALTPEAQAQLGVVWTEAGWPKLTDALLTTEQYSAIETAIAALEPAADPEQASQMSGWMFRLDALPDHARVPAFEQVQVHAGLSREDMNLMGRGEHNVTTEGRLEVTRQIVEAALALADADPGPVVRQEEADAKAIEEAKADIVQNGYPGAKADIPTVKLWVGDNPNRAARALTHELDRSTPRKRLIKFLEDLLGPDRLAQVHEAWSKAAVPPLKFVVDGAATVDGATPPSVVATADVEADGGGPSNEDPAEGVADAPEAAGEGPVATDPPSPLAEMATQMTEAFQREATARHAQRQTVTLLVDKPFTIQSLGPLLRQLADLFEEAS